MLEITPQEKNFAMKDWKTVASLVKVKIMVCAASNLASEAYKHYERQRSTEVYTNGGGSTQGQEKCSNML